MYLRLPFEYLRVSFQLDDVEEQEKRDTHSSLAHYRGGFGSGGGGGGQNKQGFVVKGAPWEVPDTASTQEFPSFGAPSSGAPAPSWGPRR